MTGSGASGEGQANSDGYISGSFTDQSDQATSSNNTDLSLGRMFLFYKNLEGRVSRLEGQVYGNSDGRRTASQIEKVGGKSCADSKECIVHTLQNIILLILP